ncbi:hypothetical protein GALL_478840 [mine drainage metagenome]|uniref:DUF4160 domain-containing protein n=1 Tax=mine drainage metagenome TaxID=410659 RepID=A0A1J5PH13_9ZZZZ
MIWPWLQPFSLKVRFTSLFFKYREELRKHIHVSHTDGEAEFWLEPQIGLAMNQGLPQKQVGEALSLVQQHHEEICNAWHIQFGN